jgi:hypothetical protein
MQRRDFLKYSAVTGTTMMFPQLASSNEFTKLVKTAWHCSKLNPVRFIAGLIFDEVAEVFLKPLAKKTFNHFVNGGSVSRSLIGSYAKSSSIITSSTIYHEPYKASVVVYGKSDYEIEQEQKKVIVELVQNLNKERFSTIHQYLKEEKIELKLYDGVTVSTVGNDLTPSELFDIDYIKYGNIAQERHIQNLLKHTQNSSFSELIV